MAGLLGDVLPYIYQRANALKRGIGDFVADPMGSIAQGVNYANDRAGGLLEATRAAADESAASGGLMYGPANKQLAGILANAYNPMGMTTGRSLEDIASSWRNAGVTLDVGYSKYRPELVTLSKIEVPIGQRKQGIGSAAMEDLVSYADETGKTLALSPSTDFGASSVGRLRDFYKRFGFVENRGRNKDFTISESMYRPPETR